MSLTTYHSIKEFKAALNMQIDKLAEEAKKIVEEENKRAIEDTYRDFGKYQRSKLETIFQNAISDFYNAYGPKWYKRKFGLYNLLSYDTDQYGMVLYKTASLESLFDETKMTVSRKAKEGTSGGLFDTVFKEGYHGGAKTIKEESVGMWGAHPHEGIPYYRNPGMIRFPGKNYTIPYLYAKWGQPAVESDSPYKTFVKNYEAEQKLNFQKVLQRFLEDDHKKYVEVINSRIKDAKNKILG